MHLNIWPIHLHSLESSITFLIPCRSLAKTKKNLNVVCKVRIREINVNSFPSIPIRRVGGLKYYFFKFTLWHIQRSRPGHLTSQILDCITCYFHRCFQKLAELGRDWLLSLLVWSSQNEFISALLTSWLILINHKLRYQRVSGLLWSIECSYSPQSVNIRFVSTRQFHQVITKSFPNHQTEYPNLPAFSCMAQSKTSNVDWN